jgi:hypothetical protein
MKAQIWAKMRNRGRGWAEYRRPDEKRAAGGRVGETAGDALRVFFSFFQNRGKTPASTSIDAHNFLLHSFRVAVVVSNVYKSWVTQSGNKDEPTKYE